MKLKRKKLKFSGKIFSLYEETWSDGEKEFYREIIEHPGAVGILPYDKENVYLVQQFRQAVKTELLEIPAGLLENGENPESAALRETKEEIGLEVKKLYRLAAVYSSPGFTNEIIWLYAGFVDPGSKVKQNLDYDEKLEVFKISHELFFKMIESGTIADSKTLIAGLLFKEKLKSLLP